MVGQIDFLGLGGSKQYAEKKIDVDVSNTISKLALNWMMIIKQKYIFFMCHKF